MIMYEARWEMKVYHLYDYRRMDDDSIVSERASEPPLERASRESKVRGQDDDYINKKITKRQDLIPLQLFFPVLIT